MSDSHSAPMTGRTRWRRFGAMMTISAAASAGVLALLADGALAAGFQVSGQQFKVSASKLVAKDFVQYGAIDSRGHISNEGGELQPVAVSAMRTAELTKLCQSVYTSLGDFGGVTLRIDAGDKGRPVEASNMTVDMSQLAGDAIFRKMEIGRDAGTLTEGTENTDDYRWEKEQRQKGMFSQQADSIEITDLKQVAWATTAGEFKLKDLRLALSWGTGKECFDDSLPNPDENRPKNLR